MPLTMPFFRAFRHGGMLVILVEQSEVVIDVLALAIHALQPVLDDDRDLVAEGGVIGDAVGNGGREDMAVAVLVLQALAVERGAARGAAEQEAARAHVARRPGEVVHALEPEHRIIDVERDHRRVGIGIGRRRRDPRRHGAGFVDAFLQHLARAVLLVIGELVGVLRAVELADLREDAILPEHALHAEGAALVRHDRHDALADILVAQQMVQHAHEGHGGGDFAAFGGFELRFERRQGRDDQRLALAAA